MPLPRHRGGSKDTQSKICRKRFGASGRAVWRGCLPSRDYHDHTLEEMLRDMKLADVPNSVTRGPHDGHQSVPLSAVCRIGQLWGGTIQLESYSGRIIVVLTSHHTFDNSKIAI